jgi:hypothetical protein
MTGINGKIIKNLESSNIKKIILFDSTCDFESFSKEFDTSDLVITFDYLSHKLLTSENIPHQISDDFLSETDLSFIQKKSYYFSEWYSQPQIQKILEYENVNLGELYFAELHYFLVPFLKKLIEIKKISKFFPNVNFISFGLNSQIIQNFSEKYIEIKTEKKSSEEFLYDSVQFPLKIGNFTHTLKFSRKNYKNIKSFSDKILNQFFGYKKRFSKNKKSVLFVEFDTLRYQKLLCSSKNYSLNVVSFCRRRPSIWNNLSFKIIKNSNCIIETESSLKNDIDKTESQKISKTRLLNLWKMENFFTNFFSFDNESFWHILSPFFKELSEKRFPEAIFEINIAKKIYEKYSFSSILVWSELGFNEKILIKLAKKRKIPIVLIQHGLAYETKTAIEYNKFMGAIPKYVDHFIVWGNSFKNYLLKSNFNDKKIETLGSTLHDDFFNASPSSQENYLLLTTTSPVDSIVNGLLVKTQIQYENVIRDICKVAKKLNKKLIIKMHPDFKEMDLTEIVKNIDKEIIVLKNENILDLISSCEVLMTIDLSTTILEAQILKKPVISINTIDYGFGKHEIFKPDSTSLIDIVNLENHLTKILKNKTFQNQLISKQNNYLETYFSNHGISTKNIFDYLAKL